MAAVGDIAVREIVEFDPGDFGNASGGAGIEAEVRQRFRSRELYRIGVPFPVRRKIEPEGIFRQKVRLGCRCPKNFCTRIHGIFHPNTELKGSCSRLSRNGRH